MPSLQNKIKESLKNLDKMSAQILEDMKMHEDWVDPRVSKRVLELGDKIYRGYEASQNEQDLILHGSSYMTCDKCIMMLHIIQQKCPDLFERMSELTAQKNDYALFLAQRFELLHKSEPIYKMLNPINLSYLIESMRLWSEFRANQREGRV